MARASDTGRIRAHEWVAYGLIGLILIAVMVSMIWVIP